MPNEAREVLTPGDLNWWYSDQPRQRTTMALLMLLDRRPDPRRLRAALVQAAAVVPRLRQRIVDAPLGLALPRWESDPTFDLSYHLRHYSLRADVEAGGSLNELFRALGPIYERPFDRTRPLWELTALDLPEEGAALFFRLHHSIADGVGGNAILGAITDATREGDPRPPVDEKPPGTWPEPDLRGRLRTALRDRLSDEMNLARSAGALVLGLARDPRRVVDAGRAAGSLAQDLLLGRGATPLKSYGRARKLGGAAIPFAPLREARARLGCRTIDLLLAGVAGAMGEWHRRAGHADARTLLTAVPINLRPPEARGLSSQVGNDLTAMLMHLPIGERDPRRRLTLVRELVARKRAHPAAGAFPAFSSAMAVLPRPLHRAASLASGGMVDLIVTNVPGIPFARFVAGAEIGAAYPIAPVMPHCPLSIALYGYRDHLFIGLDADATAITELDPVCGMLERSLAELTALSAQAPAR
jgi:diacylglycerol O-acyltransferase / wax synthase